MTNLSCLVCRRGKILRVLMMASGCGENNGQYSTHAHLGLCTLRTHYVILIHSLPKAIKHQLRQNIAHILYYGKFEFQKA